MKNYSNIQGQNRYREIKRKETKKLFLEPNGAVMTSDKKATVLAESFQ